MPASPFKPPLRSGEPTELGAWEGDGFNLKPDRDVYIEGRASTTCRLSRRTRTRGASDERSVETC